jgi:hypothetical protein
LPLSNFFFCMPFILIIISWYSFLFYCDFWKQDWVDRRNSHDRGNSYDQLSLYSYVSRESPYLRDSLFKRLPIYSYVSRESPYLFFCIKILTLFIDLLIIYDQSHRIYCCISLYWFLISTSLLSHDIIFFLKNYLFFFNK